MRMFRRVCRVTRKDNSKHENIHGSMGLANISGKVTGRRTKWLGNVKRRQRVNMPAGMTPSGNKKRPRTRWMDAVDRDMEMVGLERGMAGVLPL